MNRGSTVQGAVLSVLAVGLWVVAPAASLKLVELTHLPHGLSRVLLRACAVMLALGALEAFGPQLMEAGGKVAKRLDAWADRVAARVGPFWGRVITALPLVGLMATLAWAARPAFAGTELKIVDAWYGFLFPQQTLADRVLSSDDERPAGIRDDIVVVTMDNESISRLGWPFPRKYHAQLIDVLKEAGARSVVFDVTFQDASRDHPEWDAQLADAAKRAGNVYFGFPLVAGAGAAPSATMDALLAANALPVTPVTQKMKSMEEIAGVTQRADAPLESLSAAARGIGPVNVLLDSADDIMRHGTVAYRLGDRVYPGLMTRVAMDAMGLEPKDVRLVPGDALYLGTTRIPVDFEAKTLLRYHGRYLDGAANTFPYVPFFNVIRTDYIFTLANNPMGDDQTFLVTPNARVRLDGRDVALHELPGALMAAGTTVVGKADSSSDPAKVTELEVLTRKVKPSDLIVDMVDETHLEFTATLGSVTRKRLNSSFFRNRHVVVGASATGATDLRTTPLGQVPGVEHQTTLLNNLLANEVMSHAPDSYTLALLAFLCVLLALLAGSGAPAVVAGGSTLMVLGCVVGAYVGFNGGVHIALMPPLVTVLGSFAALLLQGYRRESLAKASAEESRTFIRQTFGRYLTDQVVDSLLSSPEGLRFGGERRTVTIMMTDLRGFTSMSARLEPENVVAILNNYLTVMTDIVVKYGGTIDEFIGDAILVVFGAPFAHEDDATRAVACAVEMLSSMPRVNQWNREHGLPEVAMGIGINTGEVVVGNIGSEKRAKYAIVGTPINLCARVESYTVGGQVFISDSTRQACGEAVDIRDSMTVSPKGIPKPITIHDVRGVKAPYNVALAEEAEELQELPTPVAFRFTVLAGKHAGDDTYMGKIRILSMQGMELETDKEMDALDNLKGVVLDTEGNPVPGDLYGKVVKPRTEAGFTYVRFTSVPEGLKAHLEKVHHAASVADHAPQGVPVSESA